MDKMNHSYKVFWKLFPNKCPFASRFNNPNLLCTLKISNLTILHFRVALVNTHYTYMCFHSRSRPKRTRTSIQRECARHVYAVGRSVGPHCQNYCDDKTVHNMVAVYDDTPLPADSHVCRSPYSHVSVLHARERARLLCECTTSVLCVDAWVALLVAPLLNTRNSQEEIK